MSRKEAQAEAKIPTPRSIGSASISFGLVTVPVKFYSSSVGAKAGVEFHLLHTCGSRLKQEYVCAKDGAKVPREDMVKGYEYAKDEYVTFTGEELKALEAEASDTIEIDQFVPMAAVDPSYYEKTYYLAPDRGGGKAYHLLCQAMKETGRVALARYASRGKQHVVLLRAVDGRILLHQLLYADELRDKESIPVGEATVTDKELALAVRLVDQIASDTFDPSTYRDEVKDRMLKRIQEKIEGGGEVAMPVRVEPKNAVDVLEALQASLERGVQ